MATRCSSSSRLSRIAAFVLPPSICALSRGCHCGTVALLQVCIFAYGQTGSGKTHTMMGDPSNLGMIPRAMEQILCSSKELEAQGWSITLRASMMEIYNEEYKDLLGKGLPAGKAHRVGLLGLLYAAPLPASASQQTEPRSAVPITTRMRCDSQVVHDPAGNTTVSDLAAVDVSNPGSFENLMEKALAQRSVGSTAMNERSSRSHCVFTLNIEGSCAGTGEAIKGVLNLIDLAGSERLSKSQAVGERLKVLQRSDEWSLVREGLRVSALTQDAPPRPAPPRRKLKPSTSPCRLSET